MKKVIVWSLAAALLIGGLFLLTGCGNETAGTTPSGDNTVSENSAVSVVSNTTSKTPDDVYVTIGDDRYKLYNEVNLNGIHYLENYVDFNTDQIGNVRMMSFNYNGSFSFDVRVYCEEEHSYDEVKATLNEYEEQTKEVGGITYAYYEYKNDLGDDVHYYLYGNNGKTYSIILFLGENPGDIEEVFMNHISFD